MRGRIFAFAVMLAMATSLTLGAWADPSGPRAPQLAAESNRLENGDFEGTFSERPDPYAPWEGSKGPLTVADGWELWYDNEQGCPPYAPGCPNPGSYNRRPEYKPEPASGRVHAGQRSQKFFTSFGTHTAGLYQKVSVPARSWVRFSIWVWAWSSQKDIADHSFGAGDYATTVGIDPKGGTDWRSTDIIWRSALTLHDQWVYLELDAYTESGKISVWTKGSQVWPVKHNDSYWDDARLVVLPAQPPATPTETPTHTPAPTPEATPEGYQPPTCSLSWSPLWKDTFEQTALSGWGRDPAKGTAAAEGGALVLRNGSQIWEAFPLAWLERKAPPSGDLRFSFRFAFSKHTAYGSTIGIGSQPYHGERSLADASARALDGRPYGEQSSLASSMRLEELDPALRERVSMLASTSPQGIDDILCISHRSTAPGEGEYRIDLLGNTVWRGTPGDSEWHALELELREHTYILKLDGAEIGRAVSYWRPQSLFVGNPVIMWIKGFWTEVALDDVMLEQCCTRTLLPALLRGYAFPEPEHTATATPTATEAATAEPSPTATMEPTPTATATTHPTPTVTMP